MLQALLAGDRTGARDKAARLQDIFGRDNLFIELQDHGIAAQHQTNPQLLEIAKDLSAPLLATNDSHYTHRRDHLAHDALRGISGVDVPPLRADWLGWWERNRAAWKGRPGAARPEERDSVATWHGLPFRSDSVLFVVDLSGSMEQPAGAVDARPRIAVATEELNRTLNALPDAARADVLAFMLEPERALGKVQPLAGGTRARIAKWFERRKRGQKGDPGAALPAAILDGEADAVLFLGDGAASAGDCLFRERIRERVRQALRLRPVVLHAVAFGSRPPDRQFLEELAESTGGRCVER